MADEIFSLRGKRVWVAGHRGMVGSALVRRLQGDGAGQGEGCEVVAVGRDSLDLTRQSAVEAWMAKAAPHVVILAAARVGGILANDREPASFIADNLSIQTNVVQGAHRAGVEKLLFLGSSCVYPKLADQPITEEALLSGPLEPTNQWYAVAKIAGLKLCQAYRRQYGSDFISVMPTNLYGPGDNFDPDKSHVAAALLRKVHQAKERGDDLVEIWGSGKPLREFLFVDDLADALVFLLKTYSGEGPINIGCGRDISIMDLALLIKDVVGYRGDFSFDRSRPDGTPRKLLDVSRLTKQGWSAPTGLREGLEQTYRWYRDNLGNMT